MSTFANSESDLPCLVVACVGLLCLVLDCLSGVVLN